MPSNCYNVGLKQCIINEMSKKERDQWDDAIRSKLEDFEVDPSPGDWEAIADRLSEKAPIPLRRTFRYWVAAAVVALLLMSGGIYFYDRDKTMKEALVSLPQTSSPEPVTKLPSRDSQEIMPSEEGIVKKQDLKAQMLRQEAKAERPVVGVGKDSIKEGIADLPMMRIQELKGERKRVAVVKPQIEKDKLRMTTVKGEGLLADATPLTSDERKAKKSARKWGFGMGGGSFSIGSNDLVPQYVTSSSMLRSESLVGMNALDADMVTQAETDIHHRTPITFGFSVSRFLNNRFALQTGLNYSYLRSEWTTNNTYHTDTDQRLHFLGIPLSLAYKIAEWNRFLFYASAGGMAEVNVAGKRRVTLYSDDVEIMKESEHVRMKEWLWSVNAHVGVSYPLIRFIHAFAEVGVDYYFDNGSEIETIHSEKPFNASFQFGFRFGF